MKDEQTETIAPRVWRHSRKGRMTGYLVDLNGDWATIYLTEGTYFDGTSEKSAGEEIMVRASFLAPEPVEGDIVARDSIQTRSV